MAGNLHASQNPAVSFECPETITAPFILELENTSDPADQFKWYLDGELISEDRNTSILFSASGRYQISLQAGEGDETRVHSRELIVKAPRECSLIMQTDKGTMAFRLFEDTPLHRDNFIKLVKDTFYNGNCFHRVISGFMIQAGESKDISRSSRLELESEITPAHVHIKGALAAARLSDAVNPQRRSSPSQFYIVQGQPVTEEQILNYAASNLIDYTEDQKHDYLEYGGTPQLDGSYTVFGEIIFGKQVIDKIAATQTDEKDKPVDNICILSIKMVD